MDTNKKVDYTKISEKLYECANETKDLLNNRPKIKKLTYADYLANIQPTITVTSPTNSLGSVLNNNSLINVTTPKEIDQFLAEMKEIDKQIDEWCCEYSDGSSIHGIAASTRRNSKILKDSTRLNETKLNDTKINVEKNFVQPAPPLTPFEINQKLIDEINNKEFSCEHLLNIRTLIAQDSQIFDSLFQHTDILYEFIDQIYTLMPAKTEMAAAITKDEQEFEKLLDNLVELLVDIHSLSQVADIGNNSNNETPTASLLAHRELLSDILHQLYKKSLSLDENKKK